MYQVIFDFLYSSLGLNSSALAGMSSQIGGASVTYAEWLAHTGTIIILAVLTFVGFKFVWWLVRLIGNAWQMRG